MASVLSDIVDLQHASTEPNTTPARPMSLMLQDTPEIRSNSPSSDEDDDNDGDGQGAQTPSGT